MSFVSPAEHDEVVCSLACLILADAGVTVNTENIDKVCFQSAYSDAVAPQGHQQHRGALLAHAVRQVPR